MSPQRSNRQALIEGTLRCLDGGSARITARQIAAAAGASPGSIKYHFGSTEALVALAMEEGFRRWLTEVEGEMAAVGELDSVDRIQRALALVAASAERHRGLVRAFLSAIARAPHDRALRRPLAASYAESRLAVARILGLGEDEAAAHAASLVLATFDGLLIQAVLDPERGFDAEQLQQGIVRLAGIGS